MSRIRNMPNYAVMKDGIDFLLIQDLGPWDKYLSITNGAEHVVRELYSNGRLRHGKQLLYIDSEGNKDEIVHEHGEYIGIAPGPKS